MKRINGWIAPKGRHDLGWQFRVLLALLLNSLIFSSLRVAGAPTFSSTDTAIPGKISVQIEPAEAVADGARWTLDGSADTASGATLDGLFPGQHAIQFTDLPNWSEPKLLSVLVIGGRQTFVTATYQPLRSIYFRDVAEQTARVGELLEFNVLSSDAADPASPPAGTRLAMTVSGSPAGPITFDPATGHFRYAPAAADRLPFSVSWSAPGVPAGTALITPANSHAAEDSVINYERPVPDPDSSDFVSIAETPGASLLFNDAQRATVDATVSGKTLVFGTGHPAHLYDIYHGRKNVASLTLYADQVIFRSALHFPQTHVIIYARELRFEGAGSLDTTPDARQLPPPPAQIDDGLTQGREGFPGHDGGAVDAFVEQFHSDPGTTTRFILRGGGGGPAGEGRGGIIEEDKRVNADQTQLYPFGSPQWYALMGRLGISICDTHNDQAEVFTQETYRARNLRCGERIAPQGGPGIPSGKPGIAGNGGQLRATIDLSPYANLAGGNAGAKGGNYPGGTLGGRFGYEFIIDDPNTGEPKGAPTYTAVDPVPGPAALALNADNPVGVPGGFTVITNAGSWLHSYAARSVLAYAKEVFLQGHPAETRQLLQDYLAILVAQPPPATAITNLTDEEFREKVNFDQVQLEIETLLHRIDSNLDYFGNPAGWVPMLSFEANFVAFQNEVRESVPILYLTYWLKHAAANVQNSVSAMEQARDHLETELGTMQAALSNAQVQVPALLNHATSINQQIFDLHARLQQKLAELQARAQQNVEDRHKVPFWKKAIGVLSVVAELVPVGQPVVGEIGAGLGLLQQFDPEHPVESAEAIAPKAFDVLKQKNITVCFGGTNSVTSTNHVTGTNSTTKAQKNNTLNTLTECGKFLGGELKQVSDAFKDSQVGKDEVAAELAKLEAADSEFNELVQTSKDLNTQKEQFAQDLATTLQAVTTLASGITQNQLGTDEIENQLESQLGAINQGALLHIQTMERRAKDRLLQYQYLVAKALQYRRLRPYSGNFALTRLFDQFQQILVATNANDSGSLTEANLTALSGVFVDELRDIVASMLDNANAPAQTQTRFIRLNADDLSRLNQGGQVILNLKDRELFDISQENVRLENLTAVSMAAHPAGGAIGALAEVGVNFEHSGLSRLSSGGDTFLFRHYQNSGVNPIVWRALYDAQTGSVGNSGLAPSEQSLISVLLGSTPGADPNIQLFSLPAAWADLIVTKNVQTDNGTDLVIDDLLLRVDIEYRNASRVLRELKIEVPGDLAPVITVNQPDANGRQDGLGTFSRAFAPFSAVTLQAPPSYGQLQFDHWLVNSNTVAGHSSLLALSVVTNTHVTAVFVSTNSASSGSPALVPVSMPRGQIGFAFQTSAGFRYTIEQSPQLTHPAWTAIDTRTGDGSRATVARPTTTAGTSFFRLRVEPLTAGP